MSGHTKNKSPLTQEDLSRYSRQIVLPEIGKDGQERLKASRVLVIGVGGLGSPVALYLAAAGVGTIGLVEFDVVERSNLHRQILFTDVDIGLRKIVAAEAHLKALSPSINVEVFAERFTALNAENILTRFDVIVDGTDNFTTRYLVNDLCVALTKPYIYGSIFRFEGQASVFNANLGPCYRCLFPEAPQANEVPNCAEGGVLGVLPGLIGMIQATETLKTILGIGASLSGRLLLIDAMTMRFQEISIAKNPDCRVCGSMGRKQTVSKIIENFRVSSAEENLPHQSEVTVLSAAELHDWRTQGKTHTLIDVRTQEELAICNIQGSINIPLSKLVDGASVIDYMDPVVLYCKSGSRSERAAAELMKKGFQNVHHLRGGILAWINEVDRQLPRY